MDQRMQAVNRLEARLLRSLDGIYAEAVKPVLRKHVKTLAQLKRLEDAGATGRARALWRSSRLLDDLAEAIAAAGRAAGEEIRQGIADIKGAAIDDTG